MDDSLRETETSSDEDDGTTYRPYILPGIGTTIRSNSFKATRRAYLKDFTGYYTFRRTSSSTTSSPSFGVHAGRSKDWIDTAQFYIFTRKAKFLAWTARV
jgi:hypothetical protein